MRRVQKILGGIFLAGVLIGGVALDYMLHQQDAYEQMCENGRRFVERNYRWDKVTADVCSLN